MASTGQYWRPVWNILSEAFPKQLLVNPLHVRALKGRKIDRMDAQWLATRLDSNIKVSSVASDLFGESGRRMLKALKVRGQVEIAP